MGYPVIKLKHLLGVVLLLGNIVVTAAWKIAADRRGKSAVVAFAQRMVTLTGFACTSSLRQGVPAFRWGPKPFGRPEPRGAPRAASRSTRRPSDAIAQASVPSSAGRRA